MARNKPHHDADRTHIYSENGVITFKPRGLNIVWGEDSRYWKLPNENDKDGTADLVQVSWLEVTGKTDSLEVGKYAVDFKVTVKSDSFGWNSCQAFVMAKVGRQGKYNWKKVNLKETNKEIKIPAETFEIDVKQENNDKQLYFGLYEVWSGKWKGGLTIHEATVKKV